MNPPSGQSPVSHLRAEEYSFRVPTPPRIVVPPPSINAAVAPQWNLAAPTNHPALRNVSYANMTTSSLLDWSYERRREAQAILPFLYLGPLNAAKDAAFLKSEGITLILAIRQKYGFKSNIMNAALRTAQELKIASDTVDLVSDRDLVGLFPTVNQKINNHLLHISQLHAKGQPGIPPLGKILIFCESGNERSAAMAAAYMMEIHEDVDYIRAMQVCQSQRFCVNFDDTMKRQLQSYWDILRAKRDVFAQQGGSQSTQTISYVAAPTPVRSTKRALSRDEDEDDTDMGGLEDMERFGGRTFAPFVDMGQEQSQR